ncbi:MAG: DUF2085 domain-containing protein [Chloroflexota bacterium]|nr:DUF2085 domain-containing protein [Chloroflexota bacterium]
MGARGDWSDGAPSRHGAYSRLWRALDVLLILIIIGPVLAPLFEASNIWLLERVARWIIYPMGLWICPQDQHAVHVAGHVTAVCSRCYAAIGGLFLVRLALTSDPAGSGVGASLSRWWRGVSRSGRIAFILGVIALWRMDLWAERLGWWSWGHGVLVATGPIVGLAVGFLAYGLLTVMTGREASWNR